jgi:hypothetical protein
MFNVSISNAGRFYENKEVCMKHIFLTLFFVSTSFGSVIGDFAPTKVGSIWKYSYNYSSSYLGPSLIKDSLSIEIELLSKEIRGNDTLVFLHIKEQGRSIGINLGALVFDTIGSSTFIDTAIISGDSVTRPSGYRCRVFPFYQTHNIDSSVLSKGLSGIDTLFYFNFSQYGSIFLQGVGLYSLLSTYYGNHQITIAINFVSLNDKPIPLGAKLSENKVPRNKTYYCQYTKRLSITKYPKISTPAFSIIGKRLYGKNLPIGLTIIKGSESINKKNR